MELVSAYRFPTDGLPIASLRVRIDELAARGGFIPEEWEEEGLGPARGGFVRLPSGRVVLMEELVYGVEHHGHRGPDVFADATDVAAAGPRKIIEDIVAAFGVTEADVTWQEDASIQSHAAAVAVWVAQYRKAREAAEPIPPRPRRFP